MMYDSIRPDPRISNLRKQPTNKTRFGVILAVKGWYLLFGTIFRASSDESNCDNCSILNSPGVSIKCRLLLSFVGIGTDRNDKVVPGKGETVGRGRD